MLTCLCNILQFLYLNNSDMFLIAQNTDCMHLLGRTASCFVFIILNLFALICIASCDSLHNVETISGLYICKLLTADLEILNEI